MIMTVEGEVNKPLKRGNEMEMLNGIENKLEKGLMGFIGCIVIYIFTLNIF